MIGNWVRNDLGEIQQVVEIRDNEKIMLAYNDFYSVDELEPIPLTAEILEKNGWVYEFDKMEYMVKYDLGVEGKNCWMMWNIKEHNLDIQRQDEKLDMYNLKAQRVCIPCDYVHQLQNALRLCGIEHEIIL